jgi:hypothetical protein
MTNEELIALAATSGALVDTAGGTRIGILTFTIDELQAFAAALSAQAAQPVAWQMREYEAHAAYVEAKRKHHAGCTI